MPEIKLHTSTRNHPKIQRLRNELSAEGVLGLYNLWCFCKEFRPDGVLMNMSKSDIALAANYGEWRDDLGDQLVDTLVRLRLLDRDEDGLLSIHNWEKYNPSKKRKATGTSINKVAVTGGELSKKIHEIVEHYKYVHPTRGKNIQPGCESWKRIRKCLQEGHSTYDLKLAIEGNALCPWHKDKPTGHSIEYIFRNSTKIEGFIERAKDPNRYDSKEEQIGHHRGSKEFGDGDQSAGF